jgi:hypothetical protein
VDTINRQYQVNAGGLDIPAALVSMLLLALAGVIFWMPVTCWVILTPVFGVIRIAEGWRHFATRNERLAPPFRRWSKLACTSARNLSFYNKGVQGVMNANAISLAMMILLALGTFVDAQARIWRIGAVGGVFLAVPDLGWLGQSPPASKGRRTPDRRAQ